MNKGIKEKGTAKAGKNFPVTDGEQKEGGKTGILQVIQQEMRQFHSGPLPPASELRQYNETHPGLADRIVVMAEKEQGFQHEIGQRNMAMQEKSLAIEGERIYRGQWLGFLIGLSGLGTSAYQATLNQPGPAMVVGGLTVISLVAVFVTGQWARSRFKPETKEIE